MEEGCKNAEKTPEGSEGSKIPEPHRKQQRSSGLTFISEDWTQTPELGASSDFKKNLRMRIHDEKTELKLIDTQKIHNLLRETSTSVTNIGTAADANNLLRRKEQDEARAQRLETLESENQITREKFEEVARGWDQALEIVIPQDLEEAINRQKALCRVIIEDKERLVADLQNELRIRDDSYVKELKRQEEELGQLIVRMEDQIKTMTRAYREELAQLERIYQQEMEVLLTRDQADWEQYMKELLEKELREMPLRRKKVENYELKIHSLMLDNTCKYSLIQIERSDQAQVVEREHQKIKATRMIASLKQIKQEDQIVVNTFNLANMMRRTRSMETELRNLLGQYSGQERQFKDRSQFLCDDYKRNILQYERIQDQIKHFAVADVRKFTDMWLMVEAEVKQLVERALVIDSLICKELGLAWERPHMPFMEVSGPIQPKKKKKKKQSSQQNQEASDGGGGCGAVAVVRVDEAAETLAEMDPEGSMCSTEEWDRMLVESVMELLFDEAGFLLDDNLSRLAEENEEKARKLKPLLKALGLEKEDLQKLAHFIYQYNIEYRKKTQPEDGELTETGDQPPEGNNGSATEGIQEGIDPNVLLPALKSFLEQVSKSRSTSAQIHPSLQQVKVRDSSEDDAYWESLSGVISEDKLKLWDAAEKALMQFHGVLKDISDLVDETRGLEEHNAELRMLLQVTLQSAPSNK